MKLKLYRKYGTWQSSIHKGKGGFGSIIASRGAKSIWYVLKVFTFKNILKALTEK